MILDPLLRWYATRDPREQRLLRGAAVVAPVLLVLVGLSMLHRAGVALEHRVATKQKDLAWITAVVPTVAAAGPGRGSDPAQTLVQIVDRSINESGLANVVTGALPDGDKTLKVEFENAPFNSLLAWVKRLAEQQGLRVKAATLDAVGEPGTVNASFTISEGV